MTDPAPAHQPTVFGADGETTTISGIAYAMPGYGWTCTCGSAGYGYASEAEAGDWADRHVAEEGTR